MLSKNELKQIRQLASKKYRSKTGLFFAEGIKVVREFCDSGWKPQAVYSLNDLDFVSYTKVDQASLDKITHFSTASCVLAIFNLRSINFTKNNGGCHRYIQAFRMRPV